MLAQTSANESGCIVSTRFSRWFTPLFFKRDRLDLIGFDSHYRRIYWDSFFGSEFSFAWRSCVRRWSNLITQFPERLNSAVWLARTPSFITTFHNLVSCSNGFYLLQQLDALFVTVMPLAKGFRTSIAKHWRERLVFAQVIWSPCAAFFFPPLDARFARGTFAIPTR